MSHVGRIHKRYPLNASVPNPPGANGCRFHGRAKSAAVSAPALKPCCVAWGARPKPRPASAANMSKRGLSARLYAPNQTLIMVNTQLPQGILGGGNEARLDWRSGPELDLRQLKKQTARLLSQTGGRIAVRLAGALRLKLQELMPGADRPTAASDAADAAP